MAYLFFATQLAIPPVRLVLGCLPSELEEQSYPEILRSNLANTILELVKLGIKVTYHFVFPRSLLTFFPFRI